MFSLEIPLNGWQSAGDVLKLFDRNQTLLNTFDHVPLIYRLSCMEDV
jgi:hypothetical protein